MEKLKGQAEAFCRKYLQCMDPDQAAAMAGCADGYAVLETKMVRRRLGDDALKPLLGLHVVVDAGGGAGGFYADVLECTGRTWYGVWPSWLSAG